MTLPAVSSENSRAPLSRPVETSWSPAAVVRSTREATSSHDDDQGDDDGDGVGAGVPDADGREQGLQGVGDGRLGDDAQAGGAQGDAELGGGQHA